MRISNDIAFYRVMFSDDALEDVCLASLEAYACGDGRKRDAGDCHGLETFGHLWGHMKWEDDVLTFYVSKAAVELGARRSKSSVLPHERSGGLKRRFLESWAPHLVMLGDFHSHPYEDRKEVHSIGGWNFSDGDRTSILEDDPTWVTTHGNRLNVVVTICRLERVPANGINVKSDSVVFFDVGEYRFWVNAMVGYEKANERRIAPDDGRGTDKRIVLLDLDGRFYNSGAQRLEDVKQSR